MTTTTALNPSISIGDRLRARREELGLTRVLLAAHAGLSVTTVQNLESGYIPRRGTAYLQLQDTLARLESAPPNGNATAANHGVSKTDGDGVGHDEP